MEALEKSKIKLKAALTLLEGKINEQKKVMQATMEENKRLLAKNRELEAQLLLLMQTSKPENADEVSSGALQTKSPDILQPSTVSSIEMSINELKNMVSKK